MAAAIAARQPLRYAGYAYDAHSATYYLSQRHYDPATMRFLTKDPARDDGEESAYQYCAGDPVGKVDPTGLYFYIVSTGGWWWYETQWYRWHTQRTWSWYFADTYAGLPFSRRDTYKRDGREYKYLIAQESHRYSRTGRTFKIVSYVVAAYYRTMSQEKNLYYFVRPAASTTPSYKFSHTIPKSARHTSGWRYYGTRLAPGSKYKVGTRYL
ncbi:MAG: RHS repeat-associated core domain-containing protein [Coriobacteriia bacterium]|nr:RHS repeat-associated core domain-containing protein [Coriobacteriia bacterium]